MHSIHIKANAAAWSQMDPTGESKEHIGKVIEWSRINEQECHRLLELIAFISRTDGLQAFDLKRNYKEKIDLIVKYRLHGSPVAVKTAC